MEEWNKKLVRVTSGWELKWKSVGGVEQKLVRLAGGCGEVDKR